jgi:hypothetical protein
MNPAMPHQFKTRPTKYAWKCVNCGQAMTDGNHDGQDPAAWQADHDRRNAGSR